MQWEDPYSVRVKNKRKQKSREENLLAFNYFYVTTCIKYTAYKII